ncbi:MAG: hypothetical protein ABMA64_21695 [Myxococcota bacterium]
MTCPRCRSELTLNTLFDPSEGHSRIHLRIKGVSPGFFTADLASFVVGRAQVCLDCGHVALSLSPEVLAQLRERLPTLEPL